MMSRVGTQTLLKNQLRCKKHCYIINSKFIHNDHQIFVECDIFCRFPDYWLEIKTIKDGLSRTSIRFYPRNNTFDWINFGNELYNQTSLVYALSVSFPRYAINTPFDAYQIYQCIQALNIFYSIMARVGVQTLLRCQLTQLNKPCYLINNRFAFKIGVLKPDMIAVDPIIIEVNRVSCRFATYWVEIHGVNRGGTWISLYHNNVALMQWSKFGYCGFQEWEPTMERLFTNIDSGKNPLQNAYEIYTILLKHSLNLNTHTDINQNG